LSPSERLTMIPKMSCSSGVTIARITLFKVLCFW
jgi:hypothetical protein